MPKQRSESNRVSAVLKLVGGVGMPERVSAVAGPDLLPDPVPCGADGIGRPRLSLGVEKHGGRVVKIPLDDLLGFVGEVDDPVVLLPLGIDDGQNDSGESGIVHSGSDGHDLFWTTSRVPDEVGNVLEILIWDSGNSFVEFLLGEDLFTVSSLGFLQPTQRTSINVALIDSPIENAFHSHDTTSFVGRTPSVLVEFLLDVERAQIGDAETFDDRVEMGDPFVIPVVALWSIDLVPIHELLDQFGHRAGIDVGRLGHQLMELPESLILVRTETVAFATDFNVPLAAGFPVPRLVLTGHDDLQLVSLNGTKWRPFLQEPL